MKLEDKVITGLATSDDDVAITIDIDEVHCLLFP